MGDEGKTPTGGSLLPPGGQAKIDQLERAGIIDSEYLSEETLIALASLTQDEIDCLVRAAEGFDKVAFLKGRGPRFGP